MTLFLPLSKDRPRNIIDHYIRSYLSFILFNIVKYGLVSGTTGFSVKHDGTHR